MNLPRNLITNKPAQRSPKNKLIKPEKTNSINFYNFKLRIHLKLNLQAEEHVVHLIHNKIVQRFPNQRCDTIKFSVFS